MTTHALSVNPKSLGIQPLLKRDKHTRRIVRTIYSRVLASDKQGEISRSALLFYDSLIQKSSLSQNTLISLGEAHFLVWMAYSLYDQILDEGGSAQLLPVANILHRLSLQSFLSVGSHKKVLSFYDAVDLGNADEMYFTRTAISNGILQIQQLPAQSVILQQLQMKCSGHFINIAILLDLIDCTDEQRSAMTSALQEYSVARQLSDDLLDWEDDLRSGKITYVTRRLIKKLQDAGHSLHIETIIPLCKAILWQSEASAVSATMTKKIRQAKASITDSQLLVHDSLYVKKFLHPIEQRAMTLTNTIQRMKQTTAGQ